MGQEAKLNLTLALALTSRGKEFQVMVQHVNIRQLEEVLAGNQNTQNFTFWCMGAFFDLLYSLLPGLEDGMMVDHLFKSIQMVTVDITKDCFSLSQR